jgi:hypothetical protein
VDARDILAPGKLISSETLREAISVGGRPPMGGPNMTVRMLGNQAVIGTRRRQIIPKLSTLEFKAVLIDEPDPTTATNIWEYQWAAARFATATDWQRFNGGFEWEVDPDGKRWDDQGNGIARNEDEQTNTATQAVHGSDIVDTAEYTITVNPIPSGTPVNMEERTFRVVYVVATVTSTYIHRRYFFSKTNSLKVTCL